MSTFITCKMTQLLLQITPAIPKVHLPCLEKLLEHSLFVELFTDLANDNTFTDK